MRLFRALTIVLVAGVLVGVVVLIVVEVAGYDDPKTAEVTRDERGEFPASLKRCPRGQLGDFGESHDPGTRGETVPPGPTSALICSSTKRSERVIRDRRDLTRLTAALNA